MDKQLPEFSSDNNVTTAMNYLLTALKAYKATTEIIFNRLHEPKTSFLFESRNVNTFKSGKQQKGLKKSSHVKEDKQKIISIASSQEGEQLPKSIGCRIRMLVGYDENGK